MRIFDDIKSGKFSVYAQWLCIGSLLFMIILPFYYIGHVGLLFLWAVLTWIMAVLIVLIEFPVLSKVVPEHSALQRALEWTQNHLFRGASYLLFSVVLWLSFIVSFSWLIIPAALLTATAVCYGLAIWRKEEISSGNNVIFKNNSNTTGGA